MMVECSKLPLLVVTVCGRALFLFLTSGWVRLPAEFKHIIERRK
jgi:hypothetical protein